MNRLLRFPLALLAAAVLAPAIHAQSTPTKKRPPAKAAPAPGPLYATRPEVLRAADDIAARHDLDREWVRQAIGQARLLPQVQRLMTPAPSGTPKNWRVYRSRFVEPIRIRAGLRFWQEHRAALERAEREYGVPAEIIVGIVGVESIYGQQMGGFNVIDAVTTLAFDFPKAHPRAAERSAFFLGELEQLLSLSQRSNVDPHAWRGSYAGAMGMPQFMPSSWVRYAVDFDGDGRVDLFNSVDDVIGSVANYFKAFGWKTGMPATYPVGFTAQPDMDALLAPDILPSFSVESFTAKGALLQSEALAHTGPLALVELQNGAEAPQYVAGTENFYVITRYNWSSYYAMAVLELGQAVREALDR
ncbi:lytic murein transglycosylase B [Pseudorhodoferax sp. Leaf265]|uniref:lytic murein transglycosylase B n=1 Tax=Pseudorhodoferax sp. Leaf265 TaxID=1736315 RepID=UPI0006F40C05|nr:lytic murein transglycosylase B [Pseudorhodoferax sp. Leaf265]KQP09054.1 lytic transglycosylase [Pseudorhodoferax sp. Leaf265]